MPEENIIFVLAHQDDEMGIYPEIERQSKRLGNNVMVYYLTNGVRQGHSSLERNREAIKVLNTVGVDSENIHFLGDDLSISDRTLHENVVEVFSHLIYRIENSPLPSKMYTLAWEGGHQDHDATHAITLAVAKKLNILGETFQFHLYRSHPFGWPFFRLMEPWDRAAKCITLRTQLPNRIKYLRLLAVYKTQKKTIFGIAPVFAWKAIRGFKIQFDAVEIAALSKRPHQGHLLYEQRGWGTFRDFDKTTRAFIEDYIF